MYNKIILIGNLTKDPEIRYTPSGVAVTTLRLAVNSRYKIGNELKEETLFIDTVVFGKQAETCNQYLNKGRRVLVEGRLQERKWESNGQQRSKFEVVASAVRFIGPKGDSDTSSDDIDITPPDEVTDTEPF
jgi:single-strand DNA-binding protein